ncbi:hypothetical protein [Henriciella marina]|uniref:Uncharacterized protein n=1 Tax=Henriciella marina TaxID=453851 RepID=A0ABT4M1G0_9PROT|nr:hypothetical protein [Henriciella marina]MCZ4299264.1 hypothetical protein [Henriciella marina]
MRAVKRHWSGRVARIIVATVVGAATTTPAWSEVCYYKIESLDYDRLHDLFPDAKVIEDPNFRSIGDVEVNATWALMGVLGDLAEEVPPGLYFGSAFGNGIWYRKGPCGLQSVEELAALYGAPYTSGLSYSFETIDREHFERAAGPNRVHCRVCYDAAPERR